MKRILVTVIIIAGVLTGARAASAQSPTIIVTEEPKLSIVVGGGISAVQNVGGLAAGAITFRLSDRVEIIGEGAWMQDVATRRLIESAESVAAYLQSSQGKPASGTIKVPTGLGDGGVRFMLTAPRHVRPYFVATAGVARMALTPTFILGGTDVTSSLPSYGVTLGSDLTGVQTKPAFGGGLGVLINQGHWYFDTGVRVTSIQSTGQTTNVLSLAAGVGFKF